MAELVQQYPNRMAGIELQQSTPVQAHLEHDSLVLDLFTSSCPIAVLCSSLHGRRMVHPIGVAVLMGMRALHGGCNAVVVAAFKIAL